MGKQPVGKFVTELNERRLGLSLDGRAFAAYLTAHGVRTSESQWSRVVNGEHGYRHSWARGVCRIWPDLAAYAAADLLVAA